MHVPLMGLAPSTPRPPAVLRWPRMSTQECPRIDPGAASADGHGAHVPPHRTSCRPNRYPPHLTTPHPLTEVIDHLGSPSRVRKPMAPLGTDESPSEVPQMRHGRSAFRNIEVSRCGTAPRKDPTLMVDSCCAAEEPRSALVIHRCSGRTSNCSDG